MPLGAALGSFKSETNVMVTAGQLSAVQCSNLSLQLKSIDGRMLAGGRNRELKRARDRTTPKC